MIMNKVTVEMEVPTPINKEEYEEAEQVLAAQTTRLVNFWKAVLGDYKKSYDLTVPSLAARLPSKLKPEAVESPGKVFAKTLVDYHMKRVPTAHSGKQYGAVKQIYEAGYTNAEALIELYDKRVAKWDGTSWFTVFYDLKNGNAPGAKAEEDLAFERKKLDDKDVNELKNRFSQYTEKGA